MQHVNDGEGSNPTGRPEQTKPDTPNERKPPPFLNEDADGVETVDSTGKPGFVKRVGREIGLNEDEQPAHETDKSQ